jgi:hypothetical protein
VHLASTELGATFIKIVTFSVHLDLPHINPVINRRVPKGMTPALLVSSALLWSMKAPPTIAGVSVFALAGYLIAVYFGWRLLLAVKNSGDINSKK